MKRIQPTTAGIDPGPDPFGKLAIAAMKRIAEVGWKRWLADERAQPSSEDPDWTNMIQAYSQGEDPPPITGHEREEPQFKCPHCRDRAYVVGPPIHRHGIVYETVKPCTCEQGRVITESTRLLKELKALEHLKDEAKRRKRMLKLQREIKELRVIDKPPRDER